MRELKVVAEGSTQKTLWSVIHLHKRAILLPLLLSTKSLLRQLQVYHERTPGISWKEFFFVDER